MFKFLLKLPANFCFRKFLLSGRSWQWVISWLYPGAGRSGYMSHCQHLLKLLSIGTKSQWRMWKLVQVVWDSCCLCQITMGICTCCHLLLRTCSPFSVRGNFTDFCFCRHQCKFQPQQLVWSKPFWYLMVAKWKGGHLCSNSGKLEVSQACIACTSLPVSTNLLEESWERFLHLPL